MAEEPTLSRGLMSAAVEKAHRFAAAYEASVPMMAEMIGAAWAYRMNVVMSRGDESPKPADRADYSNRVRQVASRNRGNDDYSQAHLMLQVVVAAWKESHPTDMDPYSSTTLYAMARAMTIAADVWEDRNRKLNYGGVNPADIVAIIDELGGVWNLWRKFKACEQIAESLQTAEAIKRSVLNLTAAIAIISSRYEVAIPIDSTAKEHQRRLNVDAELISFAVHDANTAELAKDAETKFEFSVETLKSMRHKLNLIEALMEDANEVETAEIEKAKVPDVICLGAPEPETVDTGTEETEGGTEGTTETTGAEEDTGPSNDDDKVTWDIPLAAFTNLSETTVEIVIRVPRPLADGDHTITFSSVDGVISNAKLN